MLLFLLESLIKVLEGFALALLPILLSVVLLPLLLPHLVVGELSGLVVDLPEDVVYFLFVLLVVAHVVVVDGVEFLGFVHAGCHEFLPPLVLLHVHPLF